MFGNQPYCIPSFIEICACTELWELLSENSYFWPKRHAIWTAIYWLTKSTILDGIPQNLVCWMEMV